MYCSRGRLATLLTCISVCLTSAAYAGPPLVTDDTGIVAPGGWEFIVAVTGESRDSVDSYEAPAFEASYGIAKNMQVTAAITRQVIDEPDSKSRSDFGYGELQWKWRFYEQDGMALAIGPGYQFPVTSSSRARGIIEDLRVLSLPIIGSLETGDWEFTAQLSYDLTSSGPNGMFYGVWAGYSLTERLTLLAEVYGEEVINESEGVSNWRLGLEYAIGERGTLLLGYGGDISSDLPAADQLDHDFFIGYQYETR